MDFCCGWRRPRARSGQFKDANDVLQAKPHRAQPNDPVINTAWGELFLEKYDNRRTLRSRSRPRSRPTPTTSAAQLGMARAGGGRRSAGRARAASKRALKINPNYVPAPCSRARWRSTTRRRDDAKASIEKALEINPNSLEARSLDAALAFLEDATSEFDGAGRRSVLKINPRLRRGLSRRRRPRRAQLPLRRSGRADAPGAGARRRTTRAPTADLGIASAAHRRRAGARVGARGGVQGRPATTSSPTTCWRCWTRSTSS